MTVTGQRETSRDARPWDATASAAASRSQSEHERPSRRGKASGGSAAFWMKFAGTTLLTATSPVAAAAMRQPELGLRQPDALRPATTTPGLPVTWSDVSASSATMPSDLGAAVDASDTVAGTTPVVPREGLTGRHLLDAVPRRRGAVRLGHRFYQLILARHSEDVSWLNGLPPIWNSIVYNTGKDDLDSGPDAGYRVVSLANTQHGKEGLVFIEHILRNYGQLADYTVFAQANPFEHSDHFLDLLWHPAILLPVQTMSNKFSEIVPPKSVRDVHSPDPWFRADRFSLFSMDSLYFKDCCVHTVADIYRKEYNISADTNLVAHTFDSVGLVGWVPPEQEVGTCTYGGMFGTSKAGILQHPRKVYERLGERLREHVMVGYIVERMWLMLFGGPNYIDRDLDPTTVGHNLPHGTDEGES